VGGIPRIKPIKGNVWKRKPTGQKKKQQKERRVEIPVGDQRSKPGMRNHEGKSAHSPGEF